MSKMVSVSIRSNQHLSKGDYARARSRAVEHIPAVNPNISCFKYKQSSLKELFRKKIILTFHYFLEKRDFLSILVIYVTIFFFTELDTYLMMHMKIILR